MTWRENERLGGCNFYQDHTATSSLINNLPSFIIFSVYLLVLLPFMAINVEKYAREIFCRFVWGNVANKEEQKNLK
jgi:hypothetical protein